MPVDLGAAVQVNPERKPAPQTPLTGSVTAQPGRSPQGSSPLTTPHEPPHPVLQKNGIQGGVQQLNQKVDALTAAHQRAFGTRPSPGLVLNVLQSNIPGDNFDTLFAIPKNQTDAQARQAVAAHKQQDPFEYMVTRPDGVTQPDNPIRHLAPPPAGEPNYQALQKKYPMVMEGALPIGNLNEFYGALKFLNSLIPTSETNPKLAAIDPLSMYAHATPTTQDVQQARRGVATIKQAQVELNREMGTSLPETGVFNQDWIAATQNWTKSRDYFHKELVYQAGQEGFGKNVQAYVKAWQSKQKAMSHGLYGQFLSTMPLALFGHGGFWSDLASVPGYLKGQSDNPLNIGLHSLTKSAGLVLDTVGGTVSQAKVDVAAGTTFAAYVSGLKRDRPGHVYEDALKAARDQLHANPTWLRAFGFGYVPLHEGRTLALIDQTTNVAADLILLRKPAFTGERVAAGDLAAARTSDYLNATAHWAYQDLKKYGVDGIGRASARLERGEGTNALVARSAKLIQSGRLTQDEFFNHVAELYAYGHTELRTGAVSGPTLHSLRTGNLPTPGLPGREWLTTKSHLRDWLDSFDQNARASQRTGSDTAANFAASLRTAVSHYVPKRSGYMDQGLPEQVFNFTLRHKLGDDTAALANQLESRLVRFQGTENVRGIQQIERKLQKLYYDKYPTKSPPPDEPFKAVLSTEAPSVFHFPGGGEKEITDAMGAIEGNALKINRTMNRLAIMHARVILSGINPFTGVGGFSLFWKHAIGDSLRVEAGGGGILTGVDSEVRAAKGAINKLANTDPEASRLLGSFRERMASGETKWALKRGGENVFKQTYRTGDKQAERANYMEATGGFLRRRLDDPALQAYQRGGTALTRLVLTNRVYQALWKTAKKANPDLTAEDYANVLADEYRNIEAGLSVKGLTLNDAKNFYDTVRGAKADAALGKWVDKNGVDFEVRQGLVANRGTLDDLTGRWVGNVIMAPNKFNRGRFAENILAKTFAELKKAGFDDKTALRTSIDLAQAQTKYHMLDFANRLQVEQDLRWVSYFATKHRLYWKWVLGTFIRKPGYAAAVADFAKALNSQGGITIPAKVFGQTWQIPAERLVWVPGREYDETSPLALGVFNFIKSGGNLDAVVKGATGTSGNVLTRSDTATALGTKLLKMETGAAPATYGEAYAGLDKATADRVKRAINEYQVEYFKEHGHYASQASVVKLVLLHQMGQEYWRANLPLPLVPYQPTTDQDKLLAEYETLIDPKARRQFIDQHKGFSDNFGIYQNPGSYLHNQQFFSRWAKAIDAYRSARSSLYAQAQQAGVWTTEMEQDRRELSAALERTRNQLLIDDAQQSGIDTRGLVPNGDTIPYGPWGKVVNKDPQFDPAHALSVWFPKLDKSQQADVIGPLQKMMQQELQQLNDPKYVAASNYTPSELKTRKVELLQSLEVFNSYPTDALGTLQHTYQTKYVNSYWKQYDTRFTAIAQLPTGERPAADAAFRAWRDQQDQPVKVNGVTFPAPLRMAWAMLDPKTRESRLAYLASKPAADLADYELDLLGVKHPPNVSQAFAAIDKAVNEYRAAYPGHSVGKAQLLQVAKQVDKQPGYQGFYSYYVRVVTAPRVYQFEQTNLYQSMPDKQAFDTYIGHVAIQVAAGIKANGNSSYYKQEWRKAVQTQIMPWLDDPANVRLKTYLAEFGPNFLNDLVG